MADKPMVRAEHSHMEMEIRKLLMTENSKVLEWLYSRN